MKPRTIWLQSAYAWSVPFCMEMMESMSGRLNSPLFVAGRSTEASAPFSKDWEGTPRLRLRMTNQVRRFSYVLHRWAPPANHWILAPSLGGVLCRVTKQGSSSSPSHRRGDKNEERALKLMVALTPPLPPGICWGQREKSQPFSFSYSWSGVSD